MARKHILYDFNLFILSLILWISIWPIIENVSLVLRYLWLLDVMFLVFIQV